MTTWASVSSIKRKDSFMYKTTFVLKRIFEIKWNSIKTFFLCNFLWQSTSSPLFTKLPSQGPFNLQNKWKTKRFNSTNGSEREPHRFCKWREHRNLANAFHINHPLAGSWKLVHRTMFLQPIQGHSSLIWLLPKIVWIQLSNICVNINFNYLTSRLRLSCFRNSRSFSAFSKGYRASFPDLISMFSLLYCLTFK